MVLILPSKGSSTEGSAKRGSSRMISYSTAENSKRIPFTGMGSSCSRMAPGMRAALPGGKWREKESLSFLTGKYSRETCKGANAIQASSSGQRSH